MYRGQHQWLVPAMAKAAVAAGIPYTLSSTATASIERIADAAAGRFKSASSMASSVGRNYDASFDWAALQKIRDLWPRQLILKGVMHPDDADRACAMGCDALVVSNHGGRQLDGAVATLDALPGVVQAAADRVPVWVDGGVRRGQDVVKALALGAGGVLLGRATLFGAVSDGERGAQRALEILHTELVRTLQLCGVRSVADITPALLAKVMQA